VGFRVRTGIRIAPGARPIVLAILYLAITACITGAVADDPLRSAEGLLEACGEVVRSLRDAGDSVTFTTTFSTGECWAYVGALQRAANYGDPVTHQSLLGTCLPPDSTLAQLVRVFVTYARAHPEQLHKAPSDVVLHSFQSAFPCH
jgi:hypothetical protein